MLFLTLTTTPSLLDVADCAVGPQGLPLYVRLYMIFMPPPPLPHTEALLHSLIGSDIQNSAFRECQTFNLHHQRYKISLVNFTLILVVPHLLSCHLVTLVHCHGVPFHDPEWGVLH